MEMREKIQKAQINAIFLLQMRERIRKFKINLNFSVANERKNQKSSDKSSRFLLKMRERNRKVPIKLFYENGRKMR